MPENDEPKDRVTKIFNRIVKPESRDDRDLMWTAIIAFIAGALIF